MNILSIMYGLILLAIIPFVFHLSAFGRNKNFIHIIFSFLIGNFILTTFALILGLINLFYGWLILILSLIMALFLGKFFRNKKVMNIEEIKIPKNIILLLIVFALFILVTQKFQYFAPDALHNYFLLAREIVQNNAIYRFKDIINLNDSMGNLPLLNLYIAFLFSLQKGFLPLTNIAITNITRSIPLIFSLFTMLLLFVWAKEKAGKNAPIFILITLLIFVFPWIAILPGINNMWDIGPLFADLSAHVLQEAPLLFFITSSFYFLFKYIEKRKNIYLIALLISSSLATFTKLSALVISFLIFVTLLIKCRSKKDILKIFFLTFLFHLPIIIWFIKNFYEYGNPFFPNFSTIFHDRFERIREIKTELEIGSKFARNAIPFPIFLRNFFAYFPLSILSLFYFFKNRKRLEAKFVAIVIILFILALMNGSTNRLLVRYMFPLFGIIGLYAGIELFKFYKKVFKNRMIFAIILLMLAMSFSLINTTQRTDINKIYNIPTQGEIDVINYLKEVEGTKRLNIFAEEKPFHFLWENYRVFAPEDYMFLILNNGILKENATSDYYYERFIDTNMDYIYCSAQRTKCSGLFDKINNDKEHFELVLNKDQTKLWKIKKVQ